MSAGDRSDIFTSPPALIVGVIALVALWAAILLLPAFLVGYAHRADVVTPLHSEAR